MARSSLFSFCKCVTVIVLLLAGLVASAQVRNRITRPLDNAERAQVAGPHPLARAEFDRGPVAGSMKIDRAAVVFKLAPAQQSALDKLLAEQQNPRSANFRRWLTPEQFAARFGMSDDDLSRVSAWLRSQGLSVDGYSRARTRVFFSGAAAQVARAFGTNFHHYAIDGKMRFANATGISVPSALSGMVLGFRGFDNFRPRPRARAVKANFTSHLSGNHFLAPGDFATIYNVTSTGSGQTIAVVGQTQILTADLDAFRSAAGLPATSASNFQQVLVPSGGSGFSDGDEVESDLDLEWSNAVARSATLLFVYVGANSTTMNVFDSLEYAIDQNLAPVISTSYGNCEANLGSFLSVLQQDAQQANTQGQTITAASGDSGGADCDLSSSATHGLAVDSPASLPEVTGIGGTTFSGDGAGTVTGTAPNTNAGATTFWKGTTGATDALSSALSYIPEVAWNDTAASILAGGGLSSTGGGKSGTFAKPNWQTGTGVPGDGARDVPDVSLSGSPNHDGYLICSQSFFTSGGSTATSCMSGFRASDGSSLAVVGGTSAGSPAFAGIVALLNEATGSTTGLGNINPTLYALAASSPSAFHDITSGDNIVPCTQNSKGCPATSPFQIGFTAGTGYDLVTGLGSVDVANLVSAFQGLTPTADFTLWGHTVTVAAGQQITSQIVLESVAGFSGSVDLTCSPSSSTARITCSLSPTPVTLGGSGATSTLTIITTARSVLSGPLSAQRRSGGFAWLPAGGGALFAGIFLLGGPSRRRRMAGLGLMLLVIFAAGMGCGGSSGGGSSSGTPAGSYTIAVTATSGSLSHTANVGVTVQ